MVGHFYQEHFYQGRFYQGHFYLGHFYLGHFYLGHFYLGHFYLGNISYILIIVSLCFIINKALSTGTYPDKLKIVKVIPIHKGGCTQDLNNFHPISLLSIFDKIIEKSIHSKLYMFLE